MCYNIYVIKRNYHALISVKIMNKLFYKSIDSITKKCYNIYVMRFKILKKEKGTFNMNINLNFNETQIENFKDMFSKWKDETYFSLREDFPQNILQIRSGMQPRIELEMASMVEYKRAIIEELEDEFSRVKEANFNFTDEELENNRIASGPNAGRKITKVLTEALDEAGSYYRNEQRLDYFNKLRLTENSYFIDSDPMVLMEYYLKVQTCVSPGGENQSNLLKFLASPYAYIAGDKSKSVRMLIYADFDRKRVFLHPIYGSYDSMFSLTVVKYFAQNGFAFIRYLNNGFQADFMSYTDRSNTSFIPQIKFFNGNLLEGELDFDERTDLFSRPSWVNYEGDAYANERDENIPSKELLKLYTITFDFHDTGMGILPKDRQYCGACDQTVSDDDYDYDSEMCYDCARHDHYCYECDGSHIHDDDWDYDMEMCTYCAQERREYEENECVVCGDNFRSCDFDTERKMCHTCVEDEEDNEQDEDEEVESDTSSILIPDYTDLSTTV